MIPQSILDMINDATKTVYILTALEYIKEECKNNAECCKGCSFYLDRGGQLYCFFSNYYHEGPLPEEWDLKELERRLQNDKR